MTKLTGKSVLCGLAGAILGWLLLAVFFGLGRGPGSLFFGMSIVLWFPFGIVAGGAAGLLIGSSIFPHRK